MSDLLLFILDQEKEKLKNEIADKPLSIIFDGTSRLGELLAIVHIIVFEVNTSSLLEVRQQPEGEVFRSVFY